MIGKTIVAVCLICILPHSALAGYLYWTGHTLGLDHSGDVSSVMHAYLASGDAHRALTPLGKRNLRGGDVEGV